MKAVGIVAEYNPFHRGHAFHIDETRRLLGENVPVVAVMSGHWVQRGECALTDKWTRAAMALRGGADLILELPTPWAISSAEGFARGAVALLKATGVVDTLSFGSESGKPAQLAQLAETLESREYQTALLAELDKGKAFAEARQRAAEACSGDMGALLRRPNDSLGVEYLRAAGKELRVVAVPRKGAAHDSGEDGDGFASASRLRELARKGKWEDLGVYLSPQDGAVLRETGIARMEPIERAMLARFRTMTEEDWAALPDSGAGEGLSARMVRAARRAGTLEEFYALAKTRRYAHARIRRLALWAFFGLTTGDRREDGPTYLRVLGMSERGKALLKEMKGRAALPILTKPAHISGLDHKAQRLFELECKATDLYGLCFDAVRPSGLEYTRSPVILG